MSSTNAWNRLNRGSDGGIGGQRDDGTVLRYPARDALSHLDAQLTEIGGVRDLGCAQDHLIGFVIDQVNQAGIAPRHLHGKSDDLSQHFFER